MKKYDFNFYLKDAALGRLYFSRSIIIDSICGSKTFITPIFKGAIERINSNKD